MERVKTIPVYTGRSSDFLRGSRKGGSGYGDVSSIGRAGDDVDNWKYSNSDKQSDYSLMLTVRQAGRKICLQSE